MSQKMGIHEWSYDNAITAIAALPGPLKDTEIALATSARSRAGLRPQGRVRRGAALPQLRRARRCSPTSCASSATLRRHLSDGLHHVHGERRRGGSAAAIAGAGGQPRAGIYVSGELKTGRVMAKDEDVCLHCGCAPSGVRRARGTCRSSCSKPRRRDDRCQGGGKPVVPIGICGSCC
jgi:hypothetical protein